MLWDDRGIRRRITLRFAIGRETGTRRSRGSAKSTRQEITMKVCLYFHDIGPAMEEDRFTGINS